MADICGVDQVDGEKKSVVISSVSQLTNILRLSSLSLRRFRAAAGGGTGGHGYGDSNASGSSISLSSNAPALQSYGYTALVGSDENVNARTSVHDATNAALLQPSATGEQHFVDPFLEGERPFLFGKRRTQSKTTITDPNFDGGPPIRFHTMLIRLLNRE